MYIDITVTIINDSNINNINNININDIYTNDLKLVDNDKFIQFMCDTFASIYIPRNNPVLLYFQNVHINIILLNLRIHNEFYKLVIYKEEISKYFFNVLNKEDELIVFDKCNNINLIDEYISSFKKHTIDKYEYYKQKINFRVDKEEMNYADVDFLCGINNNGNKEKYVDRNHIYTFKYNTGISIYYYVKDDVMVRIELVCKNVSGNFQYFINPLKDYIEDITIIDNEHKIENIIYPLNVSNLYLKKILKYNKQYYFDYFDHKLSVQKFLNDKYNVSILETKSTLLLLERLCSNVNSNNVIFIPFEYIIFGDKNNS